MIKELKTQHRNIIQMSFNGYTNNEIAERLEMTPVSVSVILRSPLGQAYLGGLNDTAREATLDVRKKLVSLNTHALNAFEDILNLKGKAPHSVRATVAKDVLDRNGYKPPDKHVIDMTFAAKTDQEIDAEIAAMQDSLNKAQLQDPIKQIAEPEAKAILSETVAETIIETKKYADKVKTNLDAGIIDLENNIKESEPFELDLAEIQLADAKIMTDANEEAFEKYGSPFNRTFSALDLDEAILEKIPADLFDSQSKDS